MDLGRIQSGMIVGEKIHRHDANLVKKIVKGLSTGSRRYLVAMSDPDPCLVIMCGNNIEDDRTHINFTDIKTLSLNDPPNLRMRD